ncbi:MAG: hypothetical protein AAF938_24090 [Myxococcota bacterium]
MSRLIAAFAMLLRTSLALALFSLFLPVAQAQGNLRRRLSASERASIERGELVVRPTTERRGPLRLFGGTSYILVDLPVDAVWRALNDTSPHYRHMLPQVESAREVSRDANRERQIEFHHDVGPVDASYTLRFEFDASRRAVIFRLVPERPHDIRAAWGFFRLRARGQRTLVTFGAMVDAGDGLLTGALRERLHEWVLKIPWTFRRYVEGSGRGRYER